MGNHNDKRQMGDDNRQYYSHGIPLSSYHMFDHNPQVNYLEQWKTWPCGATKKKIGWQERFKPFRAHY